MNQNNLDEIIENELIVLQEGKYKLRTFAIELDVQISAEFGVDQSLQDIRSIKGVTVVTAIDSLYMNASSTYTSRIRIKFHPQRDTTSPGKYVQRTLVPEINGNHTPGVKILRLVNKPEQIR